MKLSFFKSTLGICVLLLLISLTIYSLSYKGEGRHWNYFVLLADAFLNSRLHLLVNPPWLNELINWQGKYYVVYPPMPAILLMPFVAILGKEFLQPSLSIFIGSINVALSFLVFLKLTKKKDLAIWMSILFGFGTIHWYHAEVGSAWYFAHIVAIFFLWLAILETLTKKRLILIGILIGAAYLSRLPTILVVIFTLIFLKEKFFNLSNKRLPINFKNLYFFSVGIIGAILINSLYNYVRFGTVDNIAYRLLPIFDEPWYRYGIFNTRYIPIHLKEILTALPSFIDKPPFVIPSINVLALWITTPALILAFFANLKERLNTAALVAIIFLALPSLVHGSNGFTQFGYRFSLDYMPFLLILVGSGIGEKIKWWVKTLIVLSILINAWGVIMISHLNIWTF